MTKGYLPLAIASLLSLASPALADEKLKFPLKSTADEGTVLEERLASKARKAADYVITRKDKCPRSYDPKPYGFESGDLQSVQVTFNRQGKTYRIIVNNSDEKAPYAMDGIEIIQRERGSPIDVYNLTDYGLDGRCDGGHMSGQIQGNPGPAMVWDPSKNVTQGKRATFQRLYEKALDDVIAFYESGTRKAKRK